MRKQLEDRCTPGGDSNKAVPPRLPPALIQKIVRASFDTFRACYEAALRDDPTLTGRVTINFMIDRDGHVSRAIDADQSAPSPLAWKRERETTAPPLPEGVSRCVVAAFKTLTFPPPAGGTVTVGYPILFSPSR